VTTLVGSRLRGNWLVCLCLAAGFCVLLARNGENVIAAESRPAAIYAEACAQCHGVDGRGEDQARLALPVPVPDFTDCRFAPREPDSDWAAVITDGGPARAFHETMPAFGGALSDEEIRLALEHVRTFCASAAWPRGELNLPRPFVTEKAFPEDEVVVSTSFAAEGEGEVSTKVVYERRFGPRNQFELVVPIAAHERSAGSWRGGLGDVALGVKRAMYHSSQRGTIVSVTGEVILPTGDSDLGFGKGVAVFEPFVTFGQVLPGDSFLQFQGGVELPFDTDRAAQEAFWRTTIGRSFTQGRFGRSWSPMVEILGARELVSGEEVQWDLLPQVQVTLSTRQHIMLNVGVRLPVTNVGPRQTQVYAYLLWDWFDGGFLDGW
jgi:mono/diheme cytochrome c family protein